MRSGPPTALIVSSSVPLLAGTLVRFTQGSSSGIEGTTPSPTKQGIEAGITPPGRRLAAPRLGRCACGDVANPRGPAKSATRAPAGACRKHGLDAVLSSSERSGAVWLLDRSIAGRTHEDQADLGLPG